MKLPRLLAFTTIGSALLSAGCIGGAYTLANVNDSGSAELITREVAWDGSETLVPALPSVTRYIQAPGPGKVVARGPHRSVSTLTITNGRIHDRLMHTGAVIELIVTAPNVKTFAINGRSTLSIENFDQDRLTLSTQGVAQITANGSAREVGVSMQGDGVINLARLDAESLTGAVGGFGAVIGAPSRKADLNIGGSGSAVLLTRPPELNANVTENGRLIDASPS